MELELTGAQIDTLIALVERGPLFDGDVPSKAGRDGLIVAGLAARIVSNGEHGYTAATYAGSLAYCKMYEADTLREAMATRKGRQEKMRAAERFPVLKPPAGCPKYVRLSALSEQQADCNHGQTLKRLAERGGLCPVEIYANIHGIKWGAIRQIPEAKAIELVKSIAVE